MAFRSMRFDSRSRPLPRRFEEEGGGAWRPVAAGLAIAAMTAGVAGWYAAGVRADHENVRHPATLCLMNAPTPRAELTLLDQTDALAAGAGQRFTRLVRHLRDTLPRNGRLTIVPFGGDLGQSLQVVFDVCSPGRGSEANPLTEGALPLQRDYEALFLSPLDETAEELAKPRESPQSPITAQIMRAANDPTIGWKGEKRVLNLLTDGLEYTAKSAIYKDGRVYLEPPPPDLLKGVTVNYFELTSARHSALQTPAVRAAWKAWFEKAGAEQVNMYAPGYSTPAWQG